MTHHGLIPEAFHLPAQNAHVGGAAHGNAVAPQHVVGSRFVHRPQAYLGIGNGTGAFGHELGHAPGVAGGGIKQNEDLVHGSGAAAVWGGTPG